MSNCINVMHAWNSQYVYFLIHAILYQSNSRLLRSLILFPQYGIVDLIRKELQEELSSWLGQCLSNPISWGKVDSYYFFSSLSSCLNIFLDFVVPVLIVCMLILYRTDYTVSLYVLYHVYPYSVCEGSSCHFSPSNTHPKWKLDVVTELAPEPLLC